jgi:hypothetical protein
MFYEDVYLKKSTVSPWITLLTQSEVFRTIRVGFNETPSARQPVRMVAAAAALPRRTDNVIKI